MIKTKDDKDIIIAILVIFAIVGPWFTPYEVKYSDTVEITRISDNNTFILNNMNKKSARLINKVLVSAKDALAEE